ALGAFFALKIYALLTRRIEGETPAEIRLLYLNGPVMYRCEVDDRQLDAMERQLRALWDRIETALRSEQFPPRPGRLCDFCAFRARCPAVASAKIPPTCLAPATRRIAWLRAAVRIATPPGLAMVRTPSRGRRHAARSRPT